MGETVWWGSVRQAGKDRAVTVTVQTQTNERENTVELETDELVELSLKARMGPVGKWFNFVFGLFLTDFP